MQVRLRILKLSQDQLEQIRQLILQLGFKCHSQEILSIAQNFNVQFMIIYLRVLCNHLLVSSQSLLVKFFLNSKPRDKMILKLSKRSLRNLRKLLMKQVQSLITFKINLWLLLTNHLLDLLLKNRSKYKFKHWNKIKTKKIRNKFKN